ncbi:hypothetical protein BC628DRAFT_1339896 [Trametes gibbosa]|nr:hypothetical protein BC628DRAFT_1339896 [Trametes gibbosa]
MFSPQQMDGGKLLHPSDIIHGQYRWENNPVMTRATRRIWALQGLMLHYIVAHSCLSSFHPRYLEGPSMLGGRGSVGEMGCREVKIGSVYVGAWFRLWSPAQQWPKDNVRRTEEGQGVVCAPRRVMNFQFDQSPTAANSETSPARPETAVELAKNVADVADKNSRAKVEGHQAKLRRVMSTRTSPSEEKRATSSKARLCALWCSPIEYHMSVRKPPLLRKPRTPNEKKPNSVKRSEPPLARKSRVRTGKAANQTEATTSLPRSASHSDEPAPAQFREVMMPSQSAPVAFSSLSICSRKHLTNRRRRLAINAGAAASDTASSLSGPWPPSVVDYPYTMVHAFGPRRHAFQIAAVWTVAPSGHHQRADPPVGRPAPVPVEHWKIGKGRTANIEARSPRSNNERMSCNISAGLGAAPREIDAQLSRAAPRTVKIIAMWLCYYFKPRRLYREIPKYIIN